MNRKAVVSIFVERGVLVLIAQGCSNREIA
jgi:hypothetical protein